MISQDPQTSRSTTSSPPTNETRSQAWRYAPLGSAAIIVALSVVARIAFRGVVTSDLDVFVLRWYAKFQQLGIGVGLGKDFYNYSPPYMYLVALSTLTSRFTSAVTAIKLISTAFDVFAAFVIYKIVRLRFPQGYLPHLAAAILFAAPTIIANTAIWGQADSTYMAFLLACLYLLLVNKPWPAMLFFSVSFAFKPQAVFLLPLLVVLALWRKVSWASFLLIPVVYALAAWPAVALGRTWLEIVETYLSRPSAGKALTHNAASAYVFVPQSALNVLAGPGIALAVLAVLIWIVCTWRFTKRADRSSILLLGLISVTLTPFVLPNMHDRYFYLSDAISIALAFSLPELWFIPILFQLISGLSYSIYLLSASGDNLALAATLNFLTLVVLLARQVMLSRESRPRAAQESIPT